MPPRWWQRLVPASRSYHCGICGVRFLAFAPAAWLRDGCRRLAAAARVRA